jgi:tight adherence protein C
MVGPADAPAAAAEGVRMIPGGLRLAVGAGVVVWGGATLALSSWARLARPGLDERLRPFHPGAPPAAVPGRRPGSLADLFGPLAERAGNRMAGWFGVAEPLEVRLRRIHSPDTTRAVRLRQTALAGLALLVAAAAGSVLRLPVPVSVLFLAGGPLLGFLVPEQALARRSERWQDSVRAEMPVVAEQLAVLVNAGFSLAAALQRLARRGTGCAAADLRRVVNRVAQGASPPEALREWAEVAGVDSVARVVSVLTLHSSSSDLGRLLTTEARESRRDLHRRTLETIERRGQQVWVPVTVATLVPGAILLAVPFLSALRLFANA